MPGVSSIEGEIRSLQGGHVMGDVGGVMAAALPSPPSLERNSGTSTIKGNIPKKGMLLKKSRQEAAAADLVLSELFGGDAAEPAAAEAEEAAAAAPPAVNPLLDPVVVAIEETVSATLHLEGNIQGEAQCVGQFELTILDAAKADLACFRVEPLDQKFKFRAHPNLNKVSQAQNVLEAKDPSKAWQVNTPVPLLKWRTTASDEAFLPVALSCWPSATTDGTQVVLELELQNTKVVLEEVHIRFPAPSSSKPKIDGADVGEATYDAESQCVHWYIPTLDANKSTGTLEFWAAADQATLLPYTFQAACKGNSICPMKILECYHQGSKDAIAFATERSTRYELTGGA